MAAIFQTRELLTVPSGEAIVQIDVLMDGAGDGAGAAVVLLPSAQRDSEDFDELAQIIAAKGFKVLRPQPRGMGRSSAPPKDMSLHTLAADVAITIEHLSDGPAIVVGHAFGHWVARVLDMNHPKLVRGVVVLGGSAKVFPEGMRAAQDICSDMSQPEELRREALQKVMFAPGNDPVVWLSGWHLNLKPIYRVAGLVPAKDVWFNVANAPILDLQGDQDPWRPANTRHELKDLLSDKVTVQVIANASHALAVEQPCAVADAITSWISTLQ